MIATKKYFLNEIQNFTNKLDKKTKDEVINIAVEKAYGDYLDIIAQGNENGIAKLTAISSGLNYLLETLTKK